MFQVFLYLPTCDLHDLSFIQIKFFPFINRECGFIFLLVSILHSICRKMRDFPHYKHHDAISSFLPYDTKSVDKVFFTVRQL